MHLSLLPVASRDELQASVPTLLPCAAMSLTRSPLVTSQICTLPELVPTAMWLPRWAQQMDETVSPEAEAASALPEPEPELELEPEPELTSQSLVTLLVQADQR